MLVARPDLVHMDQAASESGADRHRLNLPDGVYTGIWWYARFPDHYSGVGSAAASTFSASSALSAAFLAGMGAPRA